mgnify:CR=1 FL=1
MQAECFESGRAVRLAQVEASLKLARTAVVGGLFNAAIVAITLWSAGPHSSIALWVFTIAGLASLRLNHARRHARGLSTSDDPAEHERFMGLLAGVNGTMWGGSMIFGGLWASPDQFTLLAMLTGGMMGAAIISYGPLPRVALMYMFPLAAGSIAGWLLSSNPLAGAGTLLILCYAVVLSRSIMASVHCRDTDSR